MNDFVKYFDKAVSSVWYLALVGALVLTYFGTGVYASWSEKRADRAYRAEYAKLADKIDNAPVGKTIQLRGKGFYVTSSKGVVTDEMFKGGH